ncbi:unnamed protein product, partial [Ectocarpus sp. 12 AP-2014]
YAGGAAHGRTHQQAKRGGKTPTMSTRKGAGATRTRKPKHQNTFAFRHNPKSQKTAKILASVNSGLCASCHDKVEWRKRYRKYRPLRQPATCNDCHKKTI